MNIGKTTLFCFLILFACQSFALEIKKVKYITDQIVTVNCAIGIATIIQVPDPPNSVVIGDQDAFKVEYLDKAITIKPLRSNGVTNLYIYTDWQRYNVKLVTGYQSNADYVVYFENYKSPPKNSKKDLIWTPFKESLNDNGLILSILRLGKTSDGVLIIEFEMTANFKEKINPEWIWITQDKVSKTIHGLFLSSLKISPDHTVTGMMQILRKDIDTTKPLDLELRRKKISQIVIPKVSKWK